MIDTLFSGQIKDLYLTFKLGDFSYAVNSANVVEIMKLSTLDSPQKPPQNAVGLLNYNNILINIVDIRLFLNITPSPYNINANIIIIKTDETIFGIIADTILDVITFDTSKLCNLQHNTNSIIDQIYCKNSQDISVINPYTLETAIKTPLTSNSDFNTKSLFPSDLSSIEKMNKRKTNLTDKSDYSLINIISLANKYISFLINNNLYAIKLDLITEIVKETNITKIPCTPSFIKGLTNLKGNFSTVISLKEFLNLSEEDKTNNKPSIAISNEETTISILIDSLGEIVDMPEDLAISQNNANITTEVIINNKIYTIINVDKLLHSKELYIFE